MFTSLNTPARTASRLVALTLAALLSACGGGGGGGGGDYTPPPPSQPDHPGGGGGPSYDVIPLGIPDVYGDITRQGIANGGIVAGTSYGGPGGVARAFLYNGKTQVELGTLGGAFSQALAVTRCSYVVGLAGTADGLAHAFLYDGSMHDLGTLGGSESAGNAINSCGKITGWAVIPFGGPHAFLYDGKTMQDLGTFGGTQSYGLAINQAGQVVGQSFGPGNAWYHAFLYDSRTGGPMQDLGSPSVNSIAVDINDAGQVVGWWRGGDPGPAPIGAFYYEKGVMRDIGTLGGNYAQALDINEAGIAVGNSNLADGAERGFVYDGKTMTSIGSLGGSRFSEAVAINASGLLVGSSIAGVSGEQHAISWTAKDGIVDLNEHLHEPPAGLVLVRALAVADDGNIAVRTNRGLALLKLRH
jgi:probable HAF family extracellular repeat protein